jgi:hypothetical protein
MLEYLQSDTKESNATMTNLMLPTKDVEKLTRRPATTYKEWIQPNSHYFL